MVPNTNNDSLMPNVNKHTVNFTDMTLGLPGGKCETYYHYQNEQRAVNYIYPIYSSVNDIQAYLIYLQLFKNYV